MFFSSFFLYRFINFSILADNYLPNPFIDFILKLQKPEVLYMSRGGPEQRPYFNKSAKMRGFPLGLYANMCPQPIFALFFTMVIRLCELQMQLGMDEGVGLSGLGSSQDGLCSYNCQEGSGLNAHLVQSKIFQCFRSEDYLLRKLEYRITAVATINFCTVFLIAV